MPRAQLDPLPKIVDRRHIDGLRALAVLPVLLFHANALFPGGFVGVDVFFVISGYLITQNHPARIEGSAVLGLASYQRRVRRIFPAVFVMFAVSTLVAYVVLVPSELKDSGKTLLASSTFSSNILFNRPAASRHTTAPRQVVSTCTTEVHVQSGARSMLLGV